MVQGGAGTIHSPNIYGPCSQYWALGQGPGSASLQPLLLSHLAERVVDTGGQGWGPAGELDG